MPLTAEDRQIGYENSRSKLARERDERWADIDALLERTTTVPTIVKIIGVDANTLSRQARRASKSAETNEEREYWRRRANIFSRYEQKRRYSR